MRFIVIACIANQFWILITVVIVGFILASNATAKIMAKTVIVVVVAIELLFKLRLYLEESRKVTFPLREDLQVIKSISGS